jgi:ABC-type bacteriocin/lantibiotic exporter with double-glycine peptidase domain
MMQRSQFTSRIQVAMTNTHKPSGGIIRLYRALWHFSAGARGKLVGALTCLFAAQVVLLGVPYVAARAINTLQLRGLDGMLEAALWLGGVIVLALISWALHGPGRLLEREVALRLRQQMSGELIERLVRLPLSWHEAQHSGATAHRVQQSVNSLAGFAENQFTYLNSVVRLVGPIVALTLIHPLVGATAVVGFIIIGVTTVGFDRKMVKLAHQENDAERRYAATILDSLSNATTLFALRQAKAVVTLLQRRLLEVFEPVKRSIVINELKWFTVDIASRTFAVILVGLFAWLATRPVMGASAAGQTLLLGSVYMVWEYAQQAGGVVTALAAHFQAFARLQADYASADTIRVAPETTHLAGDTQHTSVTWRSLEIRDLCFRHPASRKAELSLNQVTFSLQTGKRYALIGASGSGKSTLLRVLAGLYVADSAQLDTETFNTTSAEEAARFLRSCATLIPQDAEVFEGTLADNLELCESLLGPPDADQYLQALKTAQATDFVEATPAGLNSHITERGANWSGGQRSRIALARGVLAARGSQLVLLDEPTASLDANTESRVYDNLFRYFSDACIISSVHRINLLNRFDEILLMQGGGLIAQGTLAQLMQTSPEFQQLMTAYQKSHAGDE